MADRERKTYRLPQDLIEQIDEYARTHDVTNTEVVVRAIRSYLDADGMTDDVGASAALVSTLRDEVASLREQLAREQAIAMQLAQRPALPAPGRRWRWMFWKRDGEADG